MKWKFWKKNKTIKKLIITTDLIDFYMKKFKYISFEDFENFEIELNYNDSRSLMNNEIKTKILCS